MFGVWKGNNCRLSIRVHVCALYFETMLSPASTFTVSDNSETVMSRLEHTNFESTNDVCGPFCWSVLAMSLSLKSRMEPTAKVCIYIITHALSKIQWLHGGIIQANLKIKFMVSNKYAHIFVLFHFHWITFLTEWNYYCCRQITPALLHVIHSSPALPSGMGRVEIHYVMLSAVICVVEEGRPGSISVYSEHGCSISELVHRHTLIYTERQLTRAMRDRLLAEIDVCVPQCIDHTCATRTGMMPTL